MPQKKSHEEQDGSAAEKNELASEFFKENSDKTFSAKTKNSNPKKSDEEAHARSLRIRNEETLCNIRNWTYHFLFVVFVAFIIAALFMFCMWMYHSISDDKKIETFLMSAFNTVLIVLATLFADKIVSRK